MEYILSGATAESEAHVAAVVRERECRSFVGASDE
jgi:hypothetical protein